MSDQGPIGKIYGFREAARVLHVGKSAFREIIKRHPFYAKNGKVFLFSEDDLKAIWEGMRSQANEQMRSRASEQQRGSEAAVFASLKRLTGRRRRSRPAPHPTTGDGL
jgi:hypothetical protein